MCTVTFIPQHDNGFILTSNRDESPIRSTLRPAIYAVNNTQLLFPKDEVAGGTWIGVSDKKRVICLLNGGFSAHQRAASYRMSRGVIVTDLLTTKDISEAIKTYNFNGVEPFTMILINFETGTEIFELVWDGAKAHFTEKPLQPHIWSSSLLYTPTTKKAREHWFSEFIFNNIHPESTDMLNFHKTAGEGDTNIDLIMDRGFVKTKSITQVVKTTEALWMHYEDLQTQEQHSIAF